MGKRDQRDKKKEERRAKRREEKRKEKQAQGPEDEYAGIGVLSSMRGGFKNVAGTGGGKKGPKTRADQIKEIVIWVVIAALLVLVFYRFGVRR